MADGEDARLERAELKQSDARRSRWTGALWNRVKVIDSDLTEIQVPELAAERIAGFITRKGQTMSPPLSVLFSTLRALAEKDCWN